MSLPRFYHDNRFDGGTPAASTTAAGFDVLNLLDWRPYTKWQPTALPATVTGDAASLAWEFTNTADGWGGVNLTLTNNATYINVAATAADTAFDSPAALTIVGLINRYVALRIRRIAGSAWDGRLRYWTANHTASGSYEKQITDPTSGAGGAWVLAIWDMHNLTFGGEDWKASTIARLRLDLGDSASDDFDIDWIGVFPSLSADYALVWGHDLGTQGVTLEVRGSVDNFSSDDNLVATTDPEGDAPLLLEFISAQYRYWRFKIVAGASSDNPTLGIAAIGANLEMPKGLREGFDPRGRKPKGVFNKSVAGMPLGRTVQYEEWAQSLTFPDITWAWIRSTWEPAWTAHLRNTPFVFAWDSASHANELVLANVNDGFTTPHRIGSLADLRINLVGLLA